MGTWEIADSWELEAAWSCRNSLRVLSQARGWSFLFCLFLHHWLGISSRVPGQVYSRAEKVGLPHSHVLMKLACDFSSSSLKDGKGHWSYQKILGGSGPPLSSLYHDAVATRHRGGVSKLSIKSQIVFLPLRAIQSPLKLYSSTVVSRKQPQTTNKWHSVAGFQRRLVYNRRGGWICSLPIPAREHRPISHLLCM